MIPINAMQRGTTRVAMPARPAGEAAQAKPTTFGLKTISFGHNVPVVGPMTPRPVQPNSPVGSRVNYLA